MKVLDTGRDGGPAEQPGTRIPGLRPSLTLPVPTDTSLSATLGQRSGQSDKQQISVLSSATGSSLGTERGMEGVRGKDDGCFCPI